MSKSNFVSFRVLWTSLGMGIRWSANYRGHERRLYVKGPNWFQLTFPPKRTGRRLSLIVAWGRVSTKAGEQS